MKEEEIELQEIAEELVLEFGSIQYLQPFSKSHAIVSGNHLDSERF